MEDWLKFALLGLVVSSVLSVATIKLIMYIGRKLG